MRGSTVSSSLAVALFAGAMLAAVAVMPAPAEAVAISSFPGTWCDATKKLRYDYTDQGVFSWTELDLSKGGIGGTTWLPAADEVYTSPIALPFTLKFFGISRNSYQAMDNGFIWFAPTNGYGTTPYQGQTMPTAGAPNDVVGALWYDWDMSGGAMYSTNVGGAAVFEWSDAKKSPIASGTQTVPPSIHSFEVKIFPTHKIEVHVKSSNQNVGLSWGGLQRVLGIESERDAANNWQGGIYKQQTTTLANYGVRFTPIFDVAPVATGESFSAVEDTVLTVGGGAQPGLVSGLTYFISSGGLLANDTDELACVTKTAELVTDVPAAAGSLSLATNGGFTYTPAADFCGATSFTYRVKDPMGVSPSVAFVSNTVTATINVACVNDAPILDVPAALSATDDTELAITGADQISFTDVDTPTTAYRATISVTGGTVRFPSTTGLTITGNHPGDALVVDGLYGDLNSALDGLVFLPNAVPCSDGTIDIEIDDRGNTGSGGSLTDTASIPIDVTCIKVNQPPDATPASVTLGEGVMSQAFTLAATDPDGDALTWQILNPAPTKGSILGGAPSLTYQRNADGCGADSLTFKATDSGGLYDTATVSFSLQCGPNQAPVASDLSLVASQGVPRAVSLLASDPDGNPLTWQVTSSPLYGVLTGTAPALSYKASEKCVTDSFTFTASDGEYPDAGTVTIQVNCPANAPPISRGVTLQTRFMQPIPFALFGYDPDGEPLTFQVMDVPAHGTVSGMAPLLTYAPAADFDGTDRITYRVTDGLAWSQVATIEFTVLPAPPSDVVEPDQAPSHPDSDADGFADGMDNCVSTAGHQIDRDGDGLGDPCDPPEAFIDPALEVDLDADDDGIVDRSDLCPTVADPAQYDLDGDRIGDACDKDRDGDTVPNTQDNCPELPGLDQTDLDGDLVGDACDPDDDNDSIPDTSQAGIPDNCPRIANPFQQDSDQDTVGDLCDADVDGSGAVDPKCSNYQCRSTQRQPRSLSRVDEPGIDPVFAVGLGAGCALCLALVGLLAFRRK